MKAKDGTNLTRDAHKPAGLRLAPLGQSNCGFRGLQNTFSGGQSLHHPILICGSALYVRGGVRGTFRELVMSQ